MSVYAYTDISEHFEQLFSEAKAEKEVIIKSPDGDFFTLRLFKKQRLEQRLPNLKLHLTRDEILDYIHEVRER